MVHKTILVDIFISPDFFQTAKILGKYGGFGNGGGFFFGGGMCFEKNRPFFQKIFIFEPFWGVPSGPFGRFEPAVRSTARRSKSRLFGQKSKNFPGCRKVKYGVKYTTNMGSLPHGLDGTLSMQ